MFALSAAACAQIEALPKLKKSDLAFKLAQTSGIYDSNGSLITTLHGEQNRTNIALRSMPKHLRNAVIAIEDERFYQHEGVDLKAIARALVSNAASGEIREGGSTITQQYVKNVIIAPGKTAEKTIERKITEAALSRQIEQRLSKDEILERYLNTVYFGEGAYGVEAAAQIYFSKHARELKLWEAATLAGLIKSPETYDPLKYPKAARERRNIVLDRMRDNGFIDGVDATDAQTKRLKLNPFKEKERYPAPYFVDYVQRLITFDNRFNVGKTVAERTRRLFQGGLKIYTTVDLEMQAAAEAAVSGVLTYETDPHAALVAIEPETGHVKAMVGGRDWFTRLKEDRFAKLNLAILAEPDLGRVSVPGAKKNVFENRAPGTGRQAGSAFKPFVLAAALEAGIPLSRVYPAPGTMTITIPGYEPWTPQNYEGGAYGAMSLLDATVNSVNVVYAQLIRDVGVQAAVDLAEAMGIRTPLEAVPSAVLGANPVNTLGMASAYGTFATNGEHHPPVAITKIVDTTTSPDKIIYEDQSESEVVLSQSSAYLATSAMQQVITRGTGARFGNIARPAAGKTGTAQEYRDAWFAGYTPDLVAAVWVGYPEASIEMKTSCYTTTLCRPTRITVTGGSWPTQIWQAFMLRALTNTPASSFDIPSLDMVQVTIDTRNGCLADEFTPDEFQVESSFPPGAEPTEVCRESGDKLNVPDVFGFPYQEAVQILQNQGFQVARVDEPSSTYPPERVIGQSPKAGTKLAQGDTVTLTVATEAEVQTAAVPNVLGFSRDEAEQTLQNEGFGVRVIIESESDKDQAKQRRNIVWKQSPPGGSEVDPGSTVTIWVNP
ncbi:MAG TPA: transglycosylase domain-containing protein [Actinomycetota bacterium]|nr:transglycosylase domain-containing protein [Actinomycetota bacterium]